MKRKLPNLSLFFLCLCLFSSLAKADPQKNKSSDTVANNKDIFQIGLASVFVDKPRKILKQWESYLSIKLDKNVRFIQRRTYQELTNSILNGEVNAAWICTYPYIKNRDLFRLLTIPLYKNKPVYQSYFIVPKTDNLTKSITDMKGKIFAYTDIQSFTGYFYPRYLLRQQGLATDNFFRVEFFTWGHIDSIKAVADGLAQGASIDGFIWDSLNLVSPEITHRTRIVNRSKVFGFPPLVVSYKMPEKDFKQLQTVLMQMKNNSMGKKLLAGLNIDGFSYPNEDVYHSAAKLIESFSNKK